jgi:hypothetical protein
MSIKALFFKGRDTSGNKKSYRFVLFTDWNDVMNRNGI